MCSGRVLLTRSRPRLGQLIAMQRSNAVGREEALGISSAPTGAGSLFPTIVGI